MMQAIALRRLGARAVEGIDGALLTIALLLTALGLAALYSATYDTPGRVASQLANLAVALAGMWIVARIPPPTMMRFAVPAYVAGLVLLVNSDAIVPPVPNRITLGLLLPSSSGW